MEFVRCDARGVPGGICEGPSVQTTHARQIQREASVTATVQPMHQSCGVPGAVRLSSHSAAIAADAGASRKSA